MPHTSHRDTPKDVLVARAAIAQAARLGRDTTGPRVALARAKAAWLRVQADELDAQADDLIALK